MSEQRYTDEKAQQISAIGNLSMGMICVMLLGAGIIYGIYTYGNVQDSMVENFNSIQEKQQEALSTFTTTLDTMLAEEEVEREVLIELKDTLVQVRTMLEQQN